MTRVSTGDECILIEDGYSVKPEMAQAPKHGKVDFRREQIYEQTTRLSSYVRTNSKQQMA